ncbi:MAG: MotA/TolQ/ExbB proton channel family protein [Ignavibacteriales bacterium]|nr:MAG: Chemotaxis protein MotA [Stygiobacter sp.]KAF0216501.1 MAG: Chemotaxis protein [Ignavibacteria bacterium]MBI3123081.1 MotA/TolQ/ExbB proton channel family protein [Ignavibacteriales bacterium]
MTKKFGTFIGFALGISSVFGTFFLEGGSFQALFIISAIFIVFGGTFAAIIMGFGLDKFAMIPKLIKIAYFPKSYDIGRIITTFVELSIKARKEGLLMIEKDLKKFDDLFPRKMTKFVLDGTDAESLQLLAQLEMKAMQERHFSNINIFTKMGGYAPTMGIIGTVISLIMTLASAGEDPNLLIKNIATAFIATLWGVFSANLIWLPIGDRLKRCHSEEKNMMELSLEAVLTLQSGEIPSIMKARLIGMLPQREQQEKLAA